MTYANDRTQENAVDELHHNGVIKRLANAANRRLNDLVVQSYSDLRRAFTANLSPSQRGSLLARDKMVTETIEWDAYINKVKAEVLAILIKRASNDES